MPKTGLENGSGTEHTRGAVVGVAAGINKHKMTDNKLATSILKLFYNLNKKLSQVKPKFVKWRRPDVGHRLI